MGPVYNPYFTSNKIASKIVFSLSALAINKICMPLYHLPSHAKSYLSFRVDHCAQKTSVEIAQTLLNVDVRFPELE